MIRILYTNVNGLLSKKSSLLQLIEKNCINIVAITELKYQDQVSSKHQIFVIKVTNLLGKKKMEVDFIYLLSAYWEIHVESKKEMINLSSLPYKLIVKILVDSYYQQIGIKKTSQNQNEKGFSKTLKLNSITQ